MIEVILGLLIVGWLLFKWWTYPNDYWKKRGFPYLKYKFPFGNNSELVLMNVYSGYSYEKIYKEMGDMQFAGINLLRRPHLVLKDPEVIKSVMVKDFLHFTDRTNSENVYEPLSRHIFNLGGDKWKALRTHLTPTFTSGKLKNMFPLFEMCSKNLEEILKQHVNKDPEVDVKDIMGRYTTKILGTCAYGVEIDSLGDKNNDFVKVTNKIFTANIPLLRIINFWSQFIFPGIEKWLKYRITPLEIEKFLTSLVMDTISFRENSNSKRNDFIDLIMEIRSKGEITIDSIETQGKTTIEITDKDLLAQVFVFLAAGFETSSSVTTYCLYELAMNPDLQERLRKEIQGGPLTYQSLQEMRYLDMVVHETMRKYPTLPLLTRKCTKPYTMPTGCQLEKGMRVIIPVYALHHDPQYFPEPDRFDPERFTQENKASRHQYCYLPFGEGPRLCIGMRFGLLQTKMGIATILSKYRVEKTANTVRFLDFIPTPLISTVLTPVKLAFKPL